MLDGSPIIPPKKGVKRDAPDEVRWKPEMQRGHLIWFWRKSLNREKKVNRSAQTLRMSQLLHLLQCQGKRQALLEHPLHNQLIMYHSQCFIHGNPLRSGRVIRPKKFVDDVGSGVDEEASKVADKIIEEPRKVERANLIRGCNHPVFSGVGQTGCQWGPGGDQPGPRQTSQVTCSFFEELWNSDDLISSYFNKPRSWMWHLRRPHLCPSTRWMSVNLVGGRTVNRSCNGSWPLQEMPLSSRNKLKVDSAFQRRWPADHIVEQIWLTL